MDCQRMTRQIDEHAQYPDLCTHNEQIYLAYQVCRRGRDLVEVRRCGEGRPVVFTAHTRGQCYQPRLLSDGETLYLTYSECVGAQWRLMLVRMRDSAWEKPVEADRAPCLFGAALAKHEGRLWLFYTLLQPGGARAVCKFEENGIFSDRMLLRDGESYRPFGAVGGDGNLYVLFDSFHGEGYDLWCGIYRQGGFLTKKLLGRHGFAAACGVVPTERGALLLWSEIHARSRQNYGSAEISLQNGTLEIAMEPPHMEGNTWILYQGADAAGGYAAFNNSRSIVLRRRRSGGWDDCCLISPGPLTLFQRRPCCAVGPDGRIHMAWQNARGNGHTWTRNAEILYTSLTPEEYERDKDPALTGICEQFNSPVPECGKAVPTDPQILEAFLASGLESYKGLRPFWGDPHGQSRMSDGLGELDQYYNYALCKAKGDFTALTDHDCFPDLLSPSEIALMEAHCDHFNREKLVALHAYEWTSNEYRYDYGHKNVYYRDTGPFYPCTSRKGYSPDQLYRSLKPYGALAVPHHIGAVWEVVLASTDWAYHHPDVQRACEVLSRHAVFETDHDQSAYTKNVQREEGNSIREALSRGYRMGFVGGSDSHQLEAGIEGGVTCVFAPELTREGIFDGIKQRRTVATTGARILAQFEIGGQIAGGELKVLAQESVRLRAHLLAPSEIESVQVIKNGEPEFTYTLCGQSLEIEKSIFCKKSSWYYLRIALKDGQLALVSPIWVDVVEERENLCSSKN